MKILNKCHRCNSEFSVYPCFKWIKYCSKKCRYQRIPLDPRLPEGVKKAGKIRTWEAYQKGLARHREWHHRVYKKLSKEEYSKRMRKLPERFWGLTYNQRIKLKLLELYGGRCNHCGIIDSRVLQLDHKYGNGIEDRMSASNGRNIGGTYLYTLVLSGKRSKENYQILCANCNWIKRFENKEHSKKIYSGVE